MRRLNLFLPASLPAALALFLGLAVSDRAQATCTSGEASISAGSLTLHGSDAGVSDMISGAAAMWEGCGGGIPGISEGTGGGLDYTVYLSASSSGPVCGLVDNNSRTIYIVREYTANGQTYPCDINTVLAHEIGHVFGLQDSGCSGYVMSNLNVGQADNRSVQSEECTQADRNVTTIEEREREIEQRDRCPVEKILNDGCGSPLILDMNHDGIKTTSLAWPVSFDFTGEGRRTRTSWTDPTGEEAFLALDLDGNGRVDSGRELFGNSTLLPSGATASHGFEALAVYDDPLYGGNEDGRITSQDRIWRLLWLWTDRNHNGESDPGEMRPLRASHVRALHLEFEETDRFDGAVNWHRYVGAYSTRCEPAVASCLGQGLLEDIFFELELD